MGVPRHRVTGRQAFLALVALGGLVLGACAPAGPAHPSVTASGSPAASAGPADDPAALAARVTIEGLRPHLDALDRIARDNGDTRAVGTAGYDGSAAYVENALREAGYRVAEDAFDMPVFLDPGGNELALEGPNGRAFVDGKDFRPLIYSAAGEAGAPVVALGWDPGASEADGPGCESGDFADVPPGAILVLRSGPCYRRLQVENAQAAGAVGVVAAYPWWEPGEARRATLIDPDGIRIPVVAATREVGNALAAAATAGGTARLVVRASVEERSTRSLLAELPGSDPGRVVMVGAHLDSTLDGPGIDDDGSGVAAVLELARQVAGTHPRATIRFAFWAGEEYGLKGSTHYVERLATDARRAIVAYLNADMLGSPNGFRGVCDEALAAPGSAAITAAFRSDLEQAGLASETVDLEGGSDHGPFERAGIPTGGLYSGSLERRAPAQVAPYGGDAAQPPDACYHLACDDRANVDEALLGELAGSLARVVLRLAWEGAAPSP